jgi:hypothetical protein
VQHQEAIKEIHARGDDFSIKAKVVNHTKGPLADLAPPVVQWNTLIVGDADGPAWDGVNAIGLFDLQQR